MSDIPACSARLFIESTHENMTTIFFTIILKFFRDFSETSVAILTTHCG